MSIATRSIRIGWIVVKTLFFCLVFAICGLLLWRIFSSGDPKSMKTLTPNDALLAVYEEKGDELRLFRQEQRTVTSAEDNYGYFSVTQCEFLPEANQIQLVLRYNTSTLRHLAEDYQLPEVPGREEELFDMTLVLATDLTPEDPDDNDGNAEGSVAFQRLQPLTELTVSDTKNLYNYRRYVFDLTDSGVDLTSMTENGLLLAVYADIYYNGDLNYEEKPYGSLCLYDYQGEIREGSLKSRDEKALKEYAEQQAAGQ